MEFISGGWVGEEGMEFISGGWAREEVRDLVRGRGHASLCPVWAVPHAPSGMLVGIGDTLDGCLSRRTWSVV